MDSRFIQKIFAKARSHGHSVIAFNFPYFDRKDDHSSGQELTEEIYSLQYILDYINKHDFKKINLIGKSFGATVASYFLRNQTKEEQQKFTITVLGYALGDIDLKRFTGKMTIIQGDLDRYGNISTVKEDMQQAISDDITYIAISHADHSYRNPETKEPLYEDEAINNILF